MNNTIRLAVAITALIVLEIGCSSSNSAGRDTAEAARKPSGPMLNDPALEALSPQLEIVADPDGTFRFVFSAGASGTSDSKAVTALRQIDSVTFEVQDPHKGLITSITTSEVPTSGITSDRGVASLTATASVEWSPDARPPSGSMVRMILHGRNGTAERWLPMPISTVPRRPAAEPLEMAIEAEPVGNMLRFRLDVTRVGAGRPDEYLPSGELYRIELFDEGGELVWSTASGRMFTQAIQPVKPERIGESVSYTADFDGLDERTHRALAAGRYQIVASVPARPRPYTFREELNWGGKP